MSDSEYINYLTENYKNSEKYYNCDFVNIMKIFVKNNNSIYNMYKIILILLLGNDDNIDIAGLLLGLIKEKKNHKNNFYDLLYENLTFFIQSKIKKSNPLE